MLTLVENVMLPMDFCNIYPPATRENRALELLARVGVADLAGKLPGAVAGGQQQCAAVARALANDPPILIADEPTGNLDSNTAEQVMCIFEELASQGKTILLVTHDRSLALRTNRRLVISDGELVHESLVRLFPDAPHTRLLRLTKLAVSETLPSGVLLPLVAAQGPVVYIVTSGEILSVHRGDYLHYSPGSLVDPLSLRRNLYAGKTGAGLLALPRQEVLPLLSASRLSPNSEPNYAEAQSHPQNGTSPIARRQQ
jgi:putative ABC transport system ATP-binding protein